MNIYGLCLGSIMMILTIIVINDDNESGNVMMSSCQNSSCLYLECESDLKTTFFYKTLPMNKFTRHLSIN